MKHTERVTRILALWIGWREASFLFMLALLTIPVFQLRAEVYRWVDEKGHVHFSDRPTAVESREIQIREQDNSLSPADQDDRQLKMKRMLEVYEEERVEKKEAKQKQQEEQNKRKQKCARAKDRYNAHTRASGIYEYGKDGERRYLSDEERSRYMKALKAEVARWCQ